MMKKVKRNSKNIEEDYNFEYINYIKIANEKIL